MVWQSLLEECTLLVWTGAIATRLFGYWTRKRLAGLIACSFGSRGPPNDQMDGATRSHKYSLKLAASYIIRVVPLDTRQNDRRPSNITSSDGEESRTQCTQWCGRYEHNIPRRGIVNRYLYWLVLWKCWSCAHEVKGGGCKAAQTWCGTDWRSDGNTNEENSPWWKKRIPVRSRTFGVRQ